MTDELDRATSETENVVFKEIRYAKLYAALTVSAVAFFAWAAGVLLQSIL